MRTRTIAGLSLAALASTLALVPAAPALAAGAASRSCKPACTTTPALGVTSAHLLHVSVVSAHAPYKVTVEDTVMHVQVWDYSSDGSDSSVWIPGLTNSYVATISCQWPCAASASPAQLYLANY